jgi:hypothetical protein
MLQNTGGKIKGYRQQVLVGDDFTDSFLRRKIHLHPAFKCRVLALRVLLIQ